MTGEADKDRRMAWWREAKFGMFIHWGIYAVPAGVWKGEEIAGTGEWIMHQAHIPVAEYEKLVEQFNPVKFDADEWVRIARDAGMKYIVITAKHHDGFAIYDSAASDYDIMATPFGRDPIAELAEACRKQGLRLCFYYSHVQDWHHPDAVGNDWDYPNADAQDFARYLHEKAEPQVREILTQYGPIGLIWYDTPMNIAEQHSVELAELVHELQPDCLVNGRVGHGVGDYRSMGDNQLPPGLAPGDWETPATLNDTWGFKQNDHNWKDVGTLLRLLCSIASKGGNYLLNVGPTAEGLIPEPSVERLAAVGRWLRANGEAIYGSSPSPFPYEFPWGAVTSKPGKLYLHVADWPSGPFTIYGLASNVTTAYLLTDGPDVPLQVAQDYDGALKHHSMRLDLPETPPDEAVSVVVLHIDEDARVDPLVLQQPDGTVVLEALLADIHKAAADSPISLAQGGNIEGWLSEGDRLSWEFKVVEPGAFDVELLCLTEWGGGWESGHEVTISVAGQALACTVEEHERRHDLNALCNWELIATKCGRIEIPEAGAHTLTVAPRTIRADRGLGFKLRAVRLTPAAGD